MDKAKAALNDFMSKSGHHDTTVHETVAPHVKNETIKPHRHENIHTAVDKEIHQDHYHHTIQPVKDREVLPEQHTAQLGAVQHREFDHRDAEHTQRSLAAKQAAFKDERVVQDTTHSQSAVPTVAGEHVHHHIHETIQPVVHKETIQPHVVHTTVPIHEVHHNAATHHESSELPAMSMDEFKQKGGVLGGRGERYDGFEGEPKHIGSTLTHMMEGKTSKRDSAHHDMDKARSGAMHGDLNPLDGGRGNVQAGRRGGQTAEDANRSATRSERGIDGVGATGAGAPHTGNIRGVEDSGPLRGNNTSTSTNPLPKDTTSTSTTKPKASLLDKLNPSKDSNGDGQAGFMK
ncbi:hypothetical protein N0V90_006770 [Kalmusia sp. IMI 367209]|nr:hypothetical protein N0V90_006770 [Kalmusia sp. IMI 367209]